MKPLYKSTIVIWSEYNPRELELPALAQEAANGDAYCSKMEAQQIEDPTKDADWDGTDFFNEDWLGNDEIKKPEPQVAVGVEGEIKVDDLFIWNPNILEYRSAFRVVEIQGYGDLPIRCLGFFGRTDRTIFGQSEARIREMCVRATAEEIAILTH